jgi:PAS domain S-box-containing protein
MRRSARILQFANRSTLAFFIGLLFLAWVGVLSYRNAEREQRGRKSVVHTYQVLSVIDAVEDNIIEAEGRQRNYLLTGDPERLQPYKQNIGDLSSAIAEVRQLTVDNPVQQNNLHLLESLITARMARLQTGIDMRSQRGLVASVEAVHEGNGAQLMHDVRHQIDRMRAEERRLLSERTATTNAASLTTRLAIIVGNIFAVALLLASGFAMTRELRDRKIAERALRESEERFRVAVADVTTYAIITLDPQGNVSSWNAGAERIKGYTADQIIGRHFSSFYRQQDIDAGKPESVLKLALAGSRFEDEGWRVRKDGLLFWANIALTPMRAADGHLIGFSEVTRDLTEPKRAEEQIHNLNQALQQHITNLTASNRELDAFTYSLAHDLRAPLRHIHGFATILVDEYRDGMDTEAQRFLDKIVKSSKEMGTLVDGLLTFARLGRQEIERSQVDLSGLVREIRLQMEPETQDRALIWDIGTLPKVHGDPILLRQVLVNLVSNAVKYTQKKSEAYITIGAHNGGPEVTIFVRDNGAGFDMRHAAKLFGVFQRLHRAEDFEGTGIGLANVRRIVERHGGRVWAEGQAGQGATFYFTLPAEKS